MLRIQWLEEADISRIACGVTKEEVENLVKHGDDAPDPNPKHAVKGRRYRSGKTSDGRRLRVEISQHRQEITVQLVVVEPEVL